MFSRAAVIALLQGAVQTRPAGRCLHWNPLGYDRDQLVNGTETLYVTEISLNVSGVYWRGYQRSAQRSGYAPLYCLIKFVPMSATLYNTAVFRAG